MTFGTLHRTGQWMVFLAAVCVSRRDRLPPNDLSATTNPLPDGAGAGARSLPIGNGRIGGTFSGLARTLRIQRHHPLVGKRNRQRCLSKFGGIEIALGGHGDGVTDYVRELDLEYGIGRVSYKKDGITFRRVFR